MFLFSFLSALVQLDVFVDVTVDFMLVGQEFLYVYKTILPSSAQGSSPADLSMLFICEIWKDPNFYSQI